MYDLKNSKFDIHQIKKDKSQDHLLKLMNKMRKEEEKEVMGQQQQVKNIVKQQLIHKRVQSILKNSKKQPVSKPEPWVTKKWKSPLQKQNQIDKDSFKRNNSNLERQKDSTQINANKEEIKKVLKVLDLNKKLKYFGEFLEVEIEKKQKKQQEKRLQEEMKIKHLMKKYNEIQKLVKPKLCIMNFEMQCKLTFINYLEKDEYYQNIMRSKDLELMKVLISSLEADGKFTLTSYMRFYKIFVWQNADKKEQIEFATNLLMDNLQQKQIKKISQKIDIICKKINVSALNKSLEDFNDIMKRLIFGYDYEYIEDRKYYLTRKALVQSLEKNQECISIFINIFYSG